MFRWERITIRLQGLIWLLPVSVRLQPMLVLQRLETWRVSHIHHGTTGGISSLSIRTTLETTVRI